MIKFSNIAQDIMQNIRCFLNNLENSTRFQKAMNSVYDIICRVGHGNVWLAGHSLGSSIALTIGKYFANSMGVYIETYLFNPPFMSLPIERIKNENLKFGLRLAKSLFIAGLALIEDNTNGTDNNSFTKLSSWVPYLFVNPSDAICCEYIGYFSHREKMESIGAGKIGKLATQHSIVSIFTGDKEKDFEAIHLIPSAYLTINSNSQTSGLKEAHGVEQWWKQHLEVECISYHYK